MVEVLIKEPGKPTPPWGGGADTFGCTAVAGTIEEYADNGTTSI